MSEKSGHSVTAQSYPIVVGTGGQYGSQSGGIGYAGASGTDSSFDSIISDGGGGGGSNSVDGKDGGSGGGYAVPTSWGVPRYGGVTTQTDTNGATGYGNDGAMYDGVTYTGGGGGGGADSTGHGGASRDGGIGRINSITGTDIYYAGGGAGANGALGGLGGGGSGYSGSVLNGYDGTDGLGGGGGGGGATSAAHGGFGGDGVVIIRYVDDGSITATGGTVTTLTNHPVTRYNVLDNCNRTCGLGFCNCKWWNNKW